MQTNLQNLFLTAKEDFLQSYLFTLPKIIHYSVNRAGEIKENSIERTELIKKFNKMVIKDISKFTQDFINHIEILEGYLAYTSSPKAFEKAWKFRKTKISKLSMFEVQALLANHAQLIPMIKSENILNAGEKGLIKSKENSAFLYGLRHSKGNYSDALDELGNFNYQPPFDALGMLRYRWLEFISVKYNLPIFMFITMWFKHNAIESSNHITMICPLKITKLNNDFDSPLNLQLISVDESIEKIMKIRSMDFVQVDSRIRSSLTEEFVIKYNYESIKTNSKLRSNLIRWAQSKGKKCPGNRCNNIEFSNVTNKSKIHLGHIVPQNWASLYQFFQENNHIHHPDNLYLSCAECNTSLNDSFPDDTLRKNIVSEQYGTIGDYIRSDSNYFSKSEE